MTNGHISHSKQYRNDNKRRKNKASHTLCYFLSFNHGLGILGETAAQSILFCIVEMGFWCWLCPK